MSFMWGVEKGVLVSAERGMMPQNSGVCARGAYRNVRKEDSLQLFLML